MMDATHSPSIVAYMGAIIALVSLIVNAIVIPGGIYLMRAFVREEISVHDNKEHAHPNMKTLDALEKKLDELQDTIAKSLHGVGVEINGLRSELRDGLAKAREERIEGQVAATEARRKEFAEAMAAHEQREAESQRNLADEIRASVMAGRRK